MSSTVTHLGLDRSNTSSNVVTPLVCPGIIRHDGSVVRPVLIGSVAHRTHHAGGLSGARQLRQRRHLRVSGGGS
jgi:hypothetical protein